MDHWIGWKILETIDFPIDGGVSGFPVNQSIDFGCLEDVWVKALVKELILGCENWICF